jgi:hypothetical protein
MVGILPRPAPPAGTKSGGTILAPQKLTQEELATKEHKDHKGLFVLS